MKQFVGIITMKLGRALQSLGMNLALFGMEMVFNIKTN